MTKAERRRIALLSVRTLRKLARAVPNPQRMSIADHIQQQDAADSRARGRNRRKDVEYIKPEREEHDGQSITPIKKPEGFKREYQTLIERTNQAAENERGKRD